MLLSAILGDTINLRLTKMAESGPRPDLRQAVTTPAQRIRDETYSAALAELVSHQYRHAFAAHWSDGTTSSSDGQRFARVAEASTRRQPSTVASRDGCSIPYLPTSTRRSAPAW
ncbi:Tn3 family transposase [Klebsiella pneumoniae]|nr:Tn3 family transposase [Klebsiella pneumoniae]UMX71386.1 Tn3 family transposase [Klebsiella pneumoniae]UMX71433.1 Tn3 family transposase [Klebsiella pneumoniae]